MNKKKEKQFVKRTTLLRIHFAPKVWEIHYTKDLLHCNVSTQRFDDATF